MASREDCSGEDAADEDAAYPDVVVAAERLSHWYSSGARKCI
jgi:hypothetical protein